MRKLVVILAGFAVLATVSYAIYQKEELLSNGRVLLLELELDLQPGIDPRSITPRSLMQGDYMALRFKLQRDIPFTESLRDGFAVVAVDENRVGRFRRLDDGSAMMAGEEKIFFRVRGSEVKLGTNAFFFQEGDAAVYASARYGEARVGDGQFLLTGLRDANLKKLGNPRK